MNKTIRQLWQDSPTRKIENENYLKFCKVLNRLNLTVNEADAAVGVWNYTPEVAEVRVLFWEDAMNKIHSDFFKEREKEKLKKFL